MLILPIHEHGTCFHLFVSSLISFFTVVSFSEYRSFTSLVSFIARYFIFPVAMSNWIFFSWFLFLMFHCWCTRMPLISEYWLRIQLFFQIHSLGKVVFWWSLSDFPCMLSHHLQTMTISFPPIQFGCLLFLFLVWLLWLGLLILCWMGVVREGILVLFLILVGKL